LGLEELTNAGAEKPPSRGVHPGGGEQQAENANRAMQTTQVTDSSGSPTGEYKWDGSVANRALELLGKECGMFVDRTENRNVTYGISEAPATPEEWTAKYATPEKTKLN
jgi:hypothetical protein